MRSRNENIFFHVYSIVRRDERPSVRGIYSEMFGKYLENISKLAGDTALRIVTSKYMCRHARKAIDKESLDFSCC